MHAKTKQQGTAGRWWLVTQVSSCQVACKDIPHVQFYHPFLPHPPPPSTTHLYR
jgi:hypothetical protein